MFLSSIAKVGVSLRDFLESLGIRLILAVSGVGGNSIFDVLESKLDLRIMSLHNSKYSFSSSTFLDLHSSFIVSLIDNMGGGRKRSAKVFSIAFGNFKNDPDGTVFTKSRPS